ncbi:MAG: ADP-ribosylation factor-like protein [Candidatus Hodarchaeales archaeon]|jgi:small GTP-binding protein
MSSDFQYKIAVAGLANAGKTSIIQRLITGDFISVVPTRGVDTDSVEKNNIKFLVFDLGGQDVFIQTVWKTFLQKADILIYVIDASDKGSIEKSRDVLQIAISWNPSIMQLLILANKQDLDQAANEIEIMEKFEITRILAETGICDFRIFGTSAKTGVGIEESFDWLATQLTGHNNIPRVNLQNAIVYRKNLVPLSPKQNAYTELFRIDLSSNTDKRKFFSNFYTKMDIFTSNFLIGHIRTIEIAGANGEIIKLISVEKDNNYCLLVVDREDDSLTVEAIGNELLEYVIEKERNKQEIEEEKVHDMLYPFLARKEERKAHKKTREDNIIPHKRRTVKEVVEDKDRNYERKEISKKGPDFFHKMSVLDRIRTIENEERKK